MPHDRVRCLPRRCIQGVDDVGLDFGNWRIQHEVLRYLSALAARRARRVRVAGRDRKRAAELDGRSSVVHENDAPQPNAELALLVRKHVILRRGIVVQAQFDGKPDQAADQTPEGASLSLSGDQQTPF